jgi:hypothetical protein
MEIISRKEAMEKGLKRYFTGKPCKHGHVAERFIVSKACRECGNERYKNNKDAIIERTKEYRKNNKDAIRERTKEYRKNNKDAIREYLKNNKDAIRDRKKEYYKNNKDAIRDRQEEYRKNNKDTIREYYKNNKGTIREYCKNNKDAIRDRKKEYRKNNPLNAFTRGSIKRIELAVGKERINRAELELGYTQKKFIKHIESQFKDGMSWENRSEWHIDHIKPIKAFIDEGVTDPAIINALDNLQPLWANENLSKGAKYES